MDNRVWVLGHRNPDTDSIASAIAYSHLKNEVWQRDGLDQAAVPGRLGQVNAETDFVLRRFGFEVPELVADLYGRVGDVMESNVACVKPSTPFIEIGRLIREQEQRTIPVVDDEMHLLGLVSVGDVAKKYFSEDQITLSDSHLELANLAQAVEGQVLAPAGPETSGEFLPGRVLIGAMSPKSMAKYFSTGDILLIGDRENAQEAAIDAGCSCLIISGGFSVSPGIIAKAEKKGAYVISTLLDTYTVARRLTMSLPVKTIMNERIITFGPGDLLDEVRNRMVRYKHRSYPVVDEDNYLVGLINRGSLLAGPVKRVILVDHNEVGQSVDGLAQTELLEVVDHHRLGDIQTVNPVYFRNEPVGSTATLVADSYREEEVPLAPNMAGLLLAAILSDTLLFQSPTTTAKDRAIAGYLASVADIPDLDAFGRELVESGTDVENLTPTEMITSDLKQFTFGQGIDVAVAQVETVNLSRFLERTGELMEEMERYRQNSGLHIFVLMVTDLFRHGSELLVVGPGRHIVEKAFGRTLDEGRVFLPEVLSRKKQVIPPLGRAVQEVQL